MRKILSVLLALFLCIESVAFAQSLRAPTISARSWLLVDMVSGQTLASRDEEKRVDPASLTKMMTAYLVFGAIRDGRLQLNQTVTASPQVLKMDRSTSKMFLDARSPVKIQDLLYGLIVQSGNDAAVALAEAVSGDEAGFVSLMNREAARMGMSSTHFSNSYGSSDKNNYSTARDLSILATNLILDYPEFYKIYSIQEFTYNGIRQQNRNRLLWLDPTIDGITGHTADGAFSLVSSAKRDSVAGERRMLAVVLGAASNQIRAQESLKLLNWGFQNFDTVKLYDRRQVIARPNVWKGSQRQLPVGFNFDAFVTVPKGATPRLKSILERKDPLVAPIAENSRVGTLKMVLDGKVIAELPVIALEQVNVTSGFGRLWDTIQLWFK